jgi:beta-glucosidase
MAFFVAGGVWAQNKSEAALKAKISIIISKMTLKKKTCSTATRRNMGWFHN